MITSLEEKSGGTVELTANCPVQSKRQETSVNFEMDGTVSSATAFSPDDVDTAITDFFSEDPSFSGIDVTVSSAFMVQVSLLAVLIYGLVSLV